MCLCVSPHPPPAEASAAISPSTDKKGGSVYYPNLFEKTRRRVCVPADIVLGPGVNGVVSIKLFDKAAT